MNEIRVVCAANRLPSGLVLCGARHWDSVMRAQAEAIGLQDYHNVEQGFIDQYGNFLTREEAHDIAVANGQRIHRCGGDEGTLYSENLY